MEPHAGHPKTPGSTPTQDEVAKKAYAIYVKEGRPQGHAEQNWLEAEAQLQHAGSPASTEHQDHQDHHAHMAADFRKRFWISLALTLPILVLSPLLQTLVGLREAIRFPGDLYVLFGLVLGGLLVWRLAVPQGFVQGTQIPAARDDDAGRRRHHDRLSVQQRRGVRPDRQDVLLGAGHPRRHHAAGALDRDEVGDGRIEGPGGTGQAHAVRRPQAHARRQREGRAAERAGGG